jgi:hypothetical protein
MKKFLILFFAIAIAIGGLQAQQNATTNDEITQSPYKLEKGSFTTELQFSPFNITIKDDEDTYSTGPFSMLGLRGRYALSNNLALRLNFGIDVGHAKYQREIDEVNYQYYTVDSIKGTQTSKSNYTEFIISPGIEYHFGKWEKLSIYVGGELFFGMRTTQTKNDLETTAKLYARNYWDDDLELVGYSETISSYKTKNCDHYWGNNYYQNGKMFFGANVFAGIDIYIYKGLYLGAELGLGYAYQMALKGSLKGSSTTITTSLYSNIPVENKEEIDKQFNDKITGGNLAFRCNPMIRFGWKF